MKKILLLFAFYALPNVAADPTTPECKLRYIDTVYGILCSKIINDRFSICIQSDGVETVIKECNGFVSIPATEPMSLANVTKAVRAKMQKQGQLYYINAYHQLRDISSESNNGFNFPMMPKGELRDLGNRLFFVVDPSKPYIPSAQ